jgi:hypothetical protein
VFVLTIRIKLVLVKAPRSIDVMPFASEEPAFLCSA